VLALPEVVIGEGGRAMSRYRPITGPWLGLCLFIIAGCAPQPPQTAQTAQISPLQPGMARVWVLRQPDPTGGNVFAADPMVFANGAPLAQSKQGTAFFHDFQPGTYRFTVQPYGTPAGQHTTLRLAPGTTRYLQVEWIGNWEEGSSVGGASFAVLAMSPELGQQFLPIVTDLGQR
jgi:hypothetical protein